MSVNFCWTTHCNGEYTGQSKGKVVPVYVLKANEGLEVQLHSFITSTLDGNVWKSSCPGCFISGERTVSTYPIGSCCSNCRGQLQKMDRWGVRSRDILHYIYKSVLADMNGHPITCHEGTKGTALLFSLSWI